MFPEMKRKSKEMTPEDLKKSLLRGEYGTLSMISPFGYPYAVPLNYVYVPEKNCLYFHSALSGNKLECLRREDRVSFALVDSSEVLPADFTSRFSSVILFGRVRFVDDSQEKEAALFKLVEKYSPGYLEEGRAYITKDLPKTQVLCLEVEFASGKANRM